MGNQHPASIRGIGWVQLAQTFLQIDGRYDGPPYTDASPNEWRGFLKRFQGHVTQNLTNVKDIDGEQLAADMEPDELNNVLFFRYDCQNCYPSGFALLLQFESR